jgi:hypothetical protein
MSGPEQNWTETVQNWTAETEQNWIIEDLHGSDWY